MNNPEPHHTMLDIETLSTRPDAVVLSIGAVRFQLSPAFIEPLFCEKMIVLPSLRAQFALGRHSDPNTVAWWARLPSSARAHWIQYPEVCLEESRKLLNEFVQGSETIWAHGTDFDIGVLRTLFEVPPWKYNAVRDARTIYRNVKKVRSMPSDIKFIEHDPADDCVHQIWRLWERIESASDAAGAL